MKTKLTLLSIVLLSFIGCSTDDKQLSNDCECVKTYYLYFPAMSYGSSYIPAHYDIVAAQVGNFNCNEETNGYVHEVSNGHTHYKIECE